MEFSMNTKRRTVTWKNLMLMSMLFITSTVFSQTQAEMLKDEKKIDKCWKVYNNKSRTKGVEKLEKYMDDQVFSSNYAYNSIVEMKYKTYKSLMDIFGGEDAISVTVEGEDSDSFSNTFQTEIMGLFKTNFVNVCRESTLRATSSYGDKYLSRIMIDFKPDSLVGEKAKSYFDEGKQFFVDDDFELADMNFRKAIVEDPAYYEAHLFIGYNFWLQEKYDSALVYFSAGKELQPNLLSIRLHVIDALIEQGLFYRAKKECLEALTVYPGYNVKTTLNGILSKENKVLDQHRILRTFYPNDIADEDQSSLEGLPLWEDYRAAKEDVRKYCNDDGIIEENGEFEDRYLEVYSYRKMLEAHPNDLSSDLHFADKMREEGFLEPYVLVCLFHYDFYEQFKYYMSSEENRAKTIEFYEKYIIVSYNN